MTLMASVGVSRAARAAVLVVGAAIALLGLTEGRFWQATGSSADPR
jgi:C4-dicarboxylate transporter